ncbi:eCIS core domain-containing protein [Planktothrix agardhii]|uniref:eCIS core domain-containing protein n=1 Tax=Planktothrix agardhii TaxID=1160 RepID=UPI00345BE677
MQAKSDISNIQREGEEEEEIQAKSDISNIQREGEEEEEIQAKSDISNIQREGEEEEIQAKPDISNIQREGEEEEIQAKSDISAIQREGEEEEIQAKPQNKSLGGGAVSTDIETTIQSAKSGGSPLDAGLQRKMGKAMGADFSGVKVHTDSQSDKLNRSLSSRAFATGPNLFFKQGEYNPGSKTGQELIAHELTHVVQQNGGSIKRKLDKESQPNNNSVSISPLPSNSLKIQQAPPTLTSTAPPSATQNQTPSATQNQTPTAAQNQTPSATQNQTPTAAQNQTPTATQNQNPNQRTAYILDTAHLHKVSIKDASKVSQSNYIGPKLKKGDEIKVDPQVIMEGGAWVKAEKDGLSGYIRKTKYLEKLTNPLGDTNPEAEESTTLENAGEVADQVSGGVNDTYGEYGDSQDLGLAGGILDGVSGLLGMVSNAKTMISSQEIWEKLETGYGVLQSGSTLAAGVSAAVANTEGGDSSALASNITAAIADGLSGLKDAVISIVNFYKLYKSTIGKKPKEAAIFLQQLVNAALAGSKVAKSIYGIISDNIPTPVVYAISALSLAMSAINSITRLSDALSAGDTKTQMETESNRFVDGVALALGDTAKPDQANISGSKVFYPDRRGTFPNYKTYFRIKSEIKKCVDDAATKSKAEDTNFSTTEATSCQTAYQGVLDKIDGLSIEDSQKEKIKLEIPNPPQTKADFETNIVNKLGGLISDANFDDVKDVLVQIQTTANSEYAKIEENTATAAYDAVKATVNINNTEVKNKIITPTVPTTQAGFKADVVDKIGKLKIDIDQYEFADKMSEINQKRQTSGWTDVALELVNMAGDITTIAVGATGVGVLVGQGMKAGTAGFKIAHGGAKLAQKMYRNRDQTGKKSTNTKHQEYCQHARYLYGQIANLEPTNSAKAKELVGYISATGVNTTLFYAETSPQKQLEMLVSAMKKR